MYLGLFYQHAPSFQSTKSRNYGIDTSSSPMFVPVATSAAEQGCLTTHGIYSPPNNDGFKT